MGKAIKIFRGNRIIPSVFVEHKCVVVKLVTYPDSFVPKPSDGEQWLKVTGVYTEWRTNKIFVRISGFQRPYIVLAQNVIHVDELLRTRPEDHKVMACIMKKEQYNVKNDEKKPLKNVFDSLYISPVAGKHPPTRKIVGVFFTGLDDTMADKYHRQMLETIPAVTVTEVSTVYSSNIVALVDGTLYQSTEDLWAQTRELIQDREDKEHSLLWAVIVEV